MLRYAEVNENVVIFLQSKETVLSQFTAQITFWDIHLLLLHILPFCLCHIPPILSQA